MSSRGFKDNQLGWVVLLLGMAVILPTLCLSWFVLSAVKNERLVTRQKMVELYQVQAQKVSESVDQRWERAKAEVSAASCADVYQKYAELIQVENAAGVVITDSRGKVMYPVMAEVTESEQQQGLEAAAGLESKRDFSAALEAYKKAAAEGSGQFRRAAMLGWTRCLRKQGRTAEAIGVCSELAWSEPVPEDLQGARVLAGARLLLVEMLDGEGRVTAMKRALAGATEYDANAPGFLPLASETRVFFISQLLELAGAAEEMDDLKQRAIAYMQKEELSLEAANALADMQSGKWDVDTVRQMPAGQSCFTFKTAAGNDVVYIVYRAEDLKLVDIVTDGLGKSVSWKIVEKGNTAAKSDLQKGEALIKRSLSKYMPGFELELYIDRDSFESAARKQNAFYIWSAVLVVCFVGAMGAAGTGLVARQVKLNKLKNDFLATVSHELKTPLASSRMLLDTLREGRCRTQQQAGEYLELISKENERLSRLIDNFLSFSRMERNKRSFAFGKISVGEIAQLAADAIKTKYEQHNCGLEVNIDPSVGSIMADKDALTTAVINLLDNACKYSKNYDKQVWLSVYKTGQQVFFEVKDNGIGMTARQIKHAFDKFYQADQRLARSSDGCGLGLSIVKFIVDAHNGNVSASSEPGKGSRFTISVPADQERV